MSATNPQISKITAGTQQNTPEKRSRPITSSSSSCDSPNSSTQQLKKIFKSFDRGCKRFNRPNEMVLTDTVLAKINDMMDKLLDKKLGPLKTL